MKAILAMLAALAGLSSCASDDGGYCGGAYKSVAEMERALGPQRHDPASTSTRY